MASSSGTMNLFLSAGPILPSSGDTTLYTYGHDGASISGVGHKSLPLFINGANTPTGTMNLYVTGHNNPVTTVGDMNLVLYSPIPEHNNNITLYLQQATSGIVDVDTQNITLFVEAPSGTLGAIPDTASMNLFINREFESYASNISLYMKATEASNSQIPLYMYGIGAESNITLFMPALADSSGTIRLYTHGF